MVCPNCESDNIGYVNTEYNSHCKQIVWKCRSCNKEFITYIDNSNLAD